MTDISTPARLQQRPRLRPHHFLALELGYDHDHDECSSSAGCVRGVYVVAPFDDEQDAREYVERENDDAEYLEDKALFDNWLGEWLVEPEWAEPYDIRAEGWTRYDLRPVGAR